MVNKMNDEDEGQHNDCIIAMSLPYILLSLRFKQGKLQKGRKCSIKLNPSNEWRIEFEQALHGKSGECLTK